MYMNILCIFMAAIGMINLYFAIVNKGDKFRWVFLLNAILMAILVWLNLSGINLTFYFIIFTPIMIWFLVCLLYQPKYKKYLEELQKEKQDKK